MKGNIPARVGQQLELWRNVVSVPQLTRRESNRDADFGGAAIDASRDSQRLQTALERIVSIMADGQWRTLPVMADLAGCSESGASARLRDLRKPHFRERFKVQCVESRRMSGGLWTYRVLFDGQPVNGGEL